MPTEPDMCDDAAKAPTSAVLPAEDVVPVQENVNEIAPDEELSPATDEATEGTGKAVAPTAASSAAVTQDAGTSTGAAVESATGVVPALLGGLPSTGLR